MDQGLAALGTFLDQGLPALGHLLYPGLTALGPKMDLGLPALGTKMYPGQLAPRTEVHAEYDYFNADYGLTFAQYLQIMTSLKHNFKFV